MGPVRGRGINKVYKVYKGYKGYKGQVSGWSCHQIDEDEAAADDNSLVYYDACRILKFFTFNNQTCFRHLCQSRKAKHCS